MENLGFQVSNFQAYNAALSIPQINFLIQFLIFDHGYLRNSGILSFWVFVIVLDFFSYFNFKYNSIIWKPGNKKHQTQQLTKLKSIILNKLP